MIVAELHTEGSENPIKSSPFQLIDGRLHVPTLSSFFGLQHSTVLINGVVHACDVASGLTLATFREGDVVKVVGEAVAESETAATGHHRAAGEISSQSSHKGRCKLTSIVLIFICT